VLETDRLRLRPLVDGDAAFMLELLNDAEFIRNIGDRGVRTLEQARQYIRTGPGASSAQPGFSLNVVELKNSGARVGLCGLLKRDCHPDVEIGFAFLPAARGHGYASEAARAVLDFAIRSLKLTRVVALTAPDNEASIRVLGKLGFRFEQMVSWMDPVRGSRLFAFESPVPPPAGLPEIELTTR
jgi:RimJ/RimL family protein N-acetyltransferase